ncbi:hypothetical protein [Streptomyces sp. NPDC018045]|uniref:hypothetical protein n=1 Tax=Streptomyces sp. NPDC018045 TaxID=3365037 RepID=UPI0037A05AAF
MPRAIIDDELLDAVLPSRRRPAPYAVHPVRQDDHEPVADLDQRRTAWMRDRGLPVDPGRPVLSCLSESTAVRGVQLWVLYEGTLLQGAVATSLAPALDVQWRQQDGETSLWILDMVTDPSAHDAPGRWMTWWLASAFHRFTCISAVTCHESLARKVAGLHVMELRTDARQTSPHLLRRRTRHVPRLRNFVACPDPVVTVPAHPRC